MIDVNLSDSFNNYWKDFVQLIPALTVSLLILIIFYLISKKFSSLVKKRLYIRTNDLLLSTFIAKISRLAFIFLGVMIAMKLLGLTFIAGGIITGAGISAVIIGFAFKNIGENFISGLLLAFNRPFKIGDLIVTSGFTGTITSMDFRSTNIKTAEGQDVYIPNSLIINNPLINFSKDGVRRFDFSIQLDYNSDIDKAKKIILNTIIIIEEVLKEPPPIVTIEQLTSNVILKIYYWINSNKTERTILEVKGDAIENCKKSLTEGGIIFSDVAFIKITNDLISLDINSK